MASVRSPVYADSPPPALPLRARALLVASVVVVGLLNVLKPVHVDDALYLAIARQIVAHPLDPYGFEINWQHTLQPAYAVSISPPLLSYYHALWLSLGFHEGFALHVMMIPWLALLAWSVTALLARTGGHAFLATAVLIVSPGVFGGTNLMLDVPMTACLTAAVECHFRSLDRKSARWALLAGLAAGAAVLIKYPAIIFLGICLGSVVVRRDWRAIVPAMCCAATFFGWQAWSRALYGAGQLQQATSFLERFHGEGGRKTIERVLQQFALLGATFPIWIVSLRHGRAKLVGLLTALMALFIGQYLLVHSDAWYSERWKLYGFQVALFLGAFSFGEVLCSALGFKENSTIRFAAIIWILGTIAVTTLSAPFVAVRYLLPALPALLMLQALTLRASKGTLALTLGVTAAIGLGVAITDLRRAAFYPRTVAAIRVEHPNSKIFFCGHWGFQWYCEAAGMAAWDARWLDAPSGSLIVVAMRADPIPIHPFLKARMSLTPIREYVLPPAPFGLSVWRPTRPNEVGLCFYGWEFPHLPWGLSAENAETILVFEVK